MFSLTSSDASCLNKAMGKPTAQEHAMERLLQRRSTFAPAAKTGRRMRVNFKAGPVTYSRVAGKVRCSNYTSAVIRYYNLGDMVSMHVEADKHILQHPSYDSASLEMLPGSYHGLLGLLSVRVALAFTYSAGSKQLQMQQGRSTKI